MASNPCYNGDPNKQPTTAWPPGYGTAPTAPYPPQQAYPPTNTTTPQQGYPMTNPAAYPPPQVGYYPPTGAGTGFSQPPQQAPPSYEEAAKPAEYYNHDPFDGQVISFSDKSIRMGFIRKVFFILSLQLSVTVGTICLFIFSEPVKHFVQHDERGFWLYISSYALFFVLYFVLVCCDNVRRSYPANVICLVLFTITLSYLVAAISSYHETNIVLILMGVTALVCFSVMLFACQTKYDFTKWGGVLFCCALVLFFMCVFTPVWMLLNTTVGKIVLGGALALLFVAFLAFDVQLVMGGKKYELTPEEYIFASLTLYLDIIRIFLLLLALFGRGSN